MSDPRIKPITMPKWGLSMKEGKLAGWLVQPGAKLKAGDEIMEIETDKIANVVQAAEDGTLRKWDAPAGWLSRVCSRLARNLSHAEWKRFIGEVGYVTQCPGLPLAPD